MLNVGDEVVIKGDLHHGDDYSVYVAPTMEEYRGRRAIITNINGDYDIRLNVDGGQWQWTEDMFMSGGEEDVFVEKEIANFPGIEVPERDDTEYLERCVKMEEKLYERYSCSSDTFIKYPYEDRYVREANEYSNDQKKKLNDLLSRHPLWDNRTHSIVFDADLVRTIDLDIVYKFRNWVSDNLQNTIQECKWKVYYYDDVVKAFQKMERIVMAFDSLLSTERETANILGFSYGECMKEYYKWREAKLYFQNNSTSFGARRVALADAKLLWKINDIFDYIITNPSQLIETQDLADMFLSVGQMLDTNLNAVVGKKISRVVGAMCKALKLDKIKDMKTTITGREYDDGYNRRYAEFCDAINPLTFKQKTIITTDRIAFLTASFGNGWASCYTIDKTNERHNDNNYSGCYSGGTTSYGSDNTTFVLYTVKSDDNEKDIVLRDKLNRCFFSLGEGKLIQSRNYPDGRDGGDSSLAKQFREIVQKIIAECYGIPNMWVNKKGTDECERVIDYEGAGYHDHIEYNDCNVSYWKGMTGTETLNTKSIVIGSSSICPNCGGFTNYDECVVCEDCVEEAKNEHSCYRCGAVEDTENMHYIDEEWYCEDCCFYCDFHEEWEVGGDEDYYYISGYGNVCSDAVENSGYFGECEYCGEYIYLDDDDVIHTDDDKYYCCEDHAEREGYVECKDEVWRSREEVYYCEECNAYVTEDEFDFEHDMCKDCVPAEETEVA